MTASKSKAPRRFAAALAVLGALVGWSAFWGIASAPPAFVPPERPVRIVFAGDIMLDRSVARAARATGPAALFASSSALFAAADLRVANLEGTITTNPSIAEADHTILRFTFDPTLAQAALAPLNLSAVSSANNHALDFGNAGLASTRSYLAAWGINSFGDPFNHATHISTVLTKGEKTVCLVGYMELFASSTANTVGEIERLRPACTFVVVFAHWGIEYSHARTMAQQTEAHQFIDAGADLVVGAHPHVVEPVEVYHNHAIFYSLGNFMFDQNFSAGTEYGLVLEANLYHDKTAFTLVPVSVKDERSAPAEGAPRTQVLVWAGLPGAVDRLVLP